jgi:uncharacterized membrane protein YdjX (TVP38/TMEM64 family)
MAVNVDTSNNDATVVVEPFKEEAERLPVLRVLVLTVGLGALLVALYFSPLREYLTRVRDVSDHLRRLGFFGPLLFPLGVAVLVAAGFPRLPFCVISGMALGFWWGFLLAQTGTLLGNYLIFVVVRSGGGAWAQRYLAKHGPVKKLLGLNTITAVIVARQLPVPGLIINMAFGLSSLRHRHFLAGTALGQIPEAIPCTLIGAGVIQASFGRSVGLVGLAVIGLIGAWFFLRRLTDRNLPASSIHTLASGSAGGLQARF